MNDVSIMNVKVKKYIFSSVSYNQNIFVVYSGKARERDTPLSSKSDYSFWEDAATPVLNDQQLVIFMDNTLFIAGRNIKRIQCV